MTVIDLENLRQRAERTAAFENPASMTVWASDLLALLDLVDDARSALIDAEQELGRTQDENTELRQELDALESDMDTMVDQLNGTQGDA